MRPTSRKNSEDKMFDTFIESNVVYIQDENEINIITMKTNKGYSK